MRARIVITNIPWGYSLLFNLNRINICTWKMGLYRRVARRRLEEQPFGLNLSLLDGREAMNVLKVHVACVALLSYPKKFQESITVILIKQSVDYTIFSAGAV